MEFVSFSSGSKGNCYLIRNGKTSILVDAGISLTRLKRELKKLEMKAEDIQGIFITHEHADHTKGLERIREETDAEVYASKGTFAFLKSNGKEIKEGDTVNVGNCRVYAFRTSHDAQESMGYVVSGEKEIGIVTDTGFISEKTEKAIEKTDVLLIESNYEPDILTMGNYPPELKKRIASSKGHLSNHQVQKQLSKMWKSGRHPEKVLLAHMSHHNNAEVLMVRRAEQITGKGVCVPLRENETVSVAV